MEARMRNGSDSAKLSPPDNIQSPRIAGPSTSPAATHADSAVGQSTSAAHEANLIATRAYAASMAVVAGSSFEGAVSSAGFAVYRDQVIEQSRSTDPFERMMAEQLALAHLQIGQLHASAAKATSTEAARMYLAACCRLRSEFRRLVLAYQQYGVPTRASFTVVKQANLAAGNQQIAIVEGRRSSLQKNSSKKQRTELGSNASGALTHVQQDNGLAKSTKGRRGAAEPAAAKKPDRRRPAEAARRRQSE